MAGNNAIRFLRSAPEETISTRADSLNAGQPFYDIDKNLLYVGDGKAPGELSPIIGNLNIQDFWEGVTTNSMAVKAGDRSFIEIGGNMFPALCIDSDSSAGTTWQVSYNEPHAMFSDITTKIHTWGETGMFEWLNTEILNLMPKYMGANIKEKTKSGTPSKLWLLSIEEIYGTSHLPDDFTKDDKAKQFNYYKQYINSNVVNVTEIEYNVLASNRAMWLRTSHNTNLSHWGIINYKGVLSDSSAYAASAGTVFCFTI